VVRLAAPDSLEVVQTKKTRGSNLFGPRPTKPVLDDAEQGDHVKKPACAFSNEKAQAGEVGVVRLP